MYGIATLLLIVTSPTYEVSVFELQSFKSHSQCVQQLSRPKPKVQDGWWANYSCVSTAGEPTDVE